MLKEKTHEARAARKLQPIERHQAEQIAWQQRPQQARGVLRCLERCAEQSVVASTLLRFGAFSMSTLLRLGAIRAHHAFCDSRHVAAVIRVAACSSGTSLSGWLPNA